MNHVFGFASSKGGVGNEFDQAIVALFGLKHGVNFSIANLKCHVCDEQTEHTVTFTETSREWECQSCGQIEIEDNDE